MAYGIRIFSASGVDITGLLSPSFFIEAATGESGSRNFGTPPQGKTLRYMESSVSILSGSTGGAQFYVSGGAVSWSRNRGGPIYFYWGQ